MQQSGPLLGPSGLHLLHHQISSSMMAGESPRRSWGRTGHGRRRSPPAESTKGLARWHYAPLVCSARGCGCGPSWALVCRLHELLALGWGPRLSTELLDGHGARCAAVAHWERRCGRRELRSARLQLMFVAPFWFTAVYNTHVLLVLVDENMWELFDSCRLQDDGGAVGYQRLLFCCIFSLKQALSSRIRSAGLG